MNTFHALKYLYLHRNKFGRCLKKSYLSGRCYLPRSKLPTFTVFCIVTKVNGLFRALAWTSVIKLFLARNMIYFCGLNKTLCQPGVLQGFLKTHLVYLFPCWNFPINSTSPARNILKPLGVLVPRPDFSGDVLFPSQELSRTSGHF